MYKKTSAQLTMVVLVIALILIISGCAELSSPVDVPPNKGNYPIENVQRDGKKNVQKKIENGGVVENVEPKPQTVGLDENIGAPEEVAVSVDSDGHQPSSFLDRYEEQLHKLTANKKEIESLKARIKSDEKVIKDLSSMLEKSLQGSKQGEGLVMELQELHEKSNEEFENRLENESKKVEGYKSEIKGLKVKLIKARISETKTKQELVRVKTQYLIDKKKWGDNKQ